MPVLKYQEKEYEIDQEGFLLDTNTWDEDFVRACAQKDQLELTENHWEIILMLRAYFQEYDYVPNTRGLSKVVARRLGEEKGEIKYLETLFPGAPGALSSRYAGLPKPVGCV